MFFADLEFGKKYETKFLDYLEYNDVDSVEPCPPTSRFDDWDVRVKKGDKYTTYEIKADKLSAKTGNFCIEYERSNTPSGLTKTTADYYGYFVVGDKETCYVIPTDVLRTDCAKEGVKSIRCGDGYRARAYLLRVSDYEQYKVEKKR